MEIEMIPLTKHVTVRSISDNDRRRAYEFSLEDAQTIERVIYRISAM